MIRDANETDIPALLEMGRKFARVADLERIATFDDTSMEATFRHLIASEDGILLIAEGAAAGGLLHPPYWNSRARIGQELFWWVEPENRGGLGLRLLDALEAAARARGATSWAMIALHSSDPLRVGAVYERRGYRPTEHSYVRSL